MRHLPLSVIAGVVVALAVAPAAVAVPFDDAESIRIEPYTWTFTSEPLGVASASYSMGGVTYSDAWDSSTFSVWSEDENNEATLAPTEFGCAWFDHLERGGDRRRDRRVRDLRRSTERGSRG